MKTIVSLTSYPARIATAHLVVQSLLRQSVKPDKIILWLAREQFPQKNKVLPPQLRVLTKKGLTIVWTKDLRSYKKLIPALKKYPRDIIITVDDDQLYPKDLLKNLLAARRAAPRDIIAHRITRLQNNLKIFPRSYYYQNTAALNYAESLKRASFFNKQTGAGGVLYPPNCLHRDVLKEKLFWRLAPTSDDIWFWLMGVLQGTRVSVPHRHSARLNYVSGTQESALSRVNDRGQKLFFVHLKNILKAYPQLKEILARDKKANNKILRVLRWKKLFSCLGLGC